MRPQTVTRLDRVLIRLGLLAQPRLVSWDDHYRYRVAAARRRQPFIAAAVVVPILVIGVALWVSQPDDADCGGAVDTAAVVGEFVDTTGDLDPAILVCDDLGSLEAEVARHPGLLSVSVETWVDNRCQYGPSSVRGSDLCSELPG